MQEILLLYLSDGISNENLGLQLMWYNDINVFMDHWRNLACLCLLEMEKSWIPVCVGMF